MVIVYVRGRVTTRKKPVFSRRLWSIPLFSQRFFKYYSNEFECERRNDRRKWFCVKDEIWESLNTLFGYGGIGVFITAILMYVDGRVGLLSMFLIAFAGLLVNGLASVSELMRSDGSREWFREVLNQAMIGNFGKVRKLLKEGEV